MTPLPPACVDALKGLMPASVREPAARAVLDAFVAGEGSGAYFVGCRDTLWSVTDRAAPPDWVVFSADTEREARAVSAVLNYLDAKGE